MGIGDFRDYQEGLWHVLINSASIHLSMSQRPDYQNNELQRGFEHSDDEISLLDLAITIAKHKKLIIGLPLIVALVTAGVLFFMPRTYTATARILPQKLSADIVMSLLQSQPMADSLISRFNLVDYYEVGGMSAARKILAGATNISNKEIGLGVSIKVDDADPELSADLANGYVAELTPLIRHFVLTRSSERRMLLERQLPDAEQALQDAKRALLETEDVSKANQKIEAKVIALLDKAAELKARIAMKELEILAIGGFDPSKNPSFAHDQQQMQSLWDELVNIETYLPAAMRLPGPQNSYLRRVAAFKYAEARLESLLKQIEFYKVEESKEFPSLQIVNQADVPERASKPQRALIVILATFAAGFVALLSAFILQALRNAAEDKELQPKLQQLKESMRWR